MPTPEIFTSVINQYLPEPQVSLLNGILFGISLKTSRLFYEQLKMVGLLHIVVLSGMNITILSTIIALFLKPFGKILSLVLTILTIILFILFVRPQAPIIRAGIMGILTSVSFLYGRRSHGLYLLLISGVAIALIWPRWLTTISFQLSYGATLGIMLFGRFSEKKTTTEWDRLKQTIIADVKTSLAAQIFTAPIIFFYFKQIALLAPFATVLVSFIIAPLMLVGFATAVLGKMHPALGVVPSYIAYGMTSYIVWIVEVVSKVPFGYVKF